MKTDEGNRLIESLASRIKRTNDRIAELEAARLGLANERIAALEGVLYRILSAHEQSSVDWNAMGEAKKLMEGAK